MARSTLKLITVMALLIASASAQVTPCAPDGSPQLRFVAQLRVGGCALTVHDTGATEAIHLVVEPLMCVTQRFHGLLPRDDPITLQMYVSVPVTMRDDAMLAEVERQLGYMAPKSVKFANVTNISVSTDASSVIQALGFDWTPEDDVGILRLGCRGLGLEMHMCCKQLASRLRHGQLGDLNRVLLSASLALNGTATRTSHRLFVSGQEFSDASLRRAPMPPCQQLQFVKSIRLNNCTALVHRRLEMKGHFLVEPLLCHGIINVTNEPILYDNSTDTHYLKLDLVLHDDVTVDAVRTQLSDLEPRSVAFMRLWRAQSVVASALSRRFQIGPLMVSTDWKSAQVRVHCKTERWCSDLRQAISDDPFSLWRQIRWRVTSLLDATCTHVSAVSRYAFVPPIRKATDVPVSKCSRSLPAGVRWTAPVPCDVVTMPDGREFVVMQQRLTGRVAFDRDWDEYEVGFGDDTDYWIGLSAINSLSINGTTLRVEMKPINYAELHVEYAGFKVGDASTDYKLMEAEMLVNSSTVDEDAMSMYSVGRPFSTRDRETDKNMCWRSRGGRGGWWFRLCSPYNPNGVLGSNNPEETMSWYNYGGRVPLLRVKLMLQI